MHTIELDDRHVDFWRKEFCDRIIRADAPWRAGSRLAGRLEMAQIGGAVVLDATLHHPGVAIARGADRVARQQDDAVGLTLVRSGSARIQVRGFEQEIAAGDVCLLHGAESFTKVMGADYREQFLYLPKALAESLLGDRVPDSLHLVAPRTGLGSFLAETLRGLAHYRSLLQTHEWATLFGSILNLAATVFGKERQRDSRPAARALQRGRVERYIQTHAHEPELSPARIAAALRMSPRYLHRLFERGPSVGATILATRLERCRASLAAADATHRTVSEVAFANGFNDAAHFSRAFRARFGATPSEVLAHARELARANRRD